jgi:hypothetical protein
MLYRLGKRVQPKLYKIKLLSLVVLGCLIIGALTISLTMSHDLVFVNMPLIKGVGDTAAQISRSRKPSKTVSISKLATGPISPGSVSQVTDTLLNYPCTGLFPPENASLASAVTPELRKLAQYEQLCGGDLVARSSLFAPTPDTVAAAQSDANDMSIRLEDYASHNVTPLVFFEPDTDSGTNLDLDAYQAGDYDDALDSYFSDLKADGITDSMMGMWVLLPEGNIPVWTSVDPSTFVADVTLTAQYQKKYFPNSQDAILLDSETYPSASSWDGGAYISLLPYVQGIPAGLINSFGLEGFPWAPPANQSGDTEYNPRVFLRTDLAAAAARTLGVSNIWLNTGTFNQMYTQDSAQTVTASPFERQTILYGILEQAEALKSQGFDVEVHLFAQNKSNVAEATDWSYWQSQPGDSPSTAVLTTFIHNLTVNNIPLWLFDTYDQ